MSESLDYQDNKKPWRLTPKVRRFVDKLYDRSFFDLYYREPIQLGIARLFTAKIDSPRHTFDDAPFENANMAMMPIDPRSSYPTTFYLLEQKLAIQFELISIFKNLGIDFFNNDEILYLEINKNTKNSKIIAYVPPIVALGWVPELDDIFNPMIYTIDGQHRHFIAGYLGKKINSLTIRNIKGRHHKVPNTWSAVKIMNMVPPTEEKAFYCFPDPNTDFLPLSAMLNPYIPCDWGKFVRIPGSKY